jgi:RHS repeat-associated protein
MLTLTNNIKHRIQTILIITGLLLTGNGFAQGTLVTAPMTGSPAPGVYYSPTQIVLSGNPGFSFTASPGSSAVFRIAPPDCIRLATTPSANQNYILTTIPKILGFDPGYNPLIIGYTSCEAMQTIQYVDGLGRPIQTVQVKASPNGNDIVQPIAYDAFDRETTKYLPYANNPALTSDGSYKADAITQQGNFYNQSTTWASNIANTINPVSGIKYEASPLDRVIEQGAPGDAWQLTGTVNQSGVTAGHTVKTIYASNDGTTYWAKLFGVGVDANGTPTLIDQGTYGANQLYVTVAQDENWTNGQTDVRLNTTETYKDKEGHIVLKRTFNNNNGIETLSTYYVYDDYNNLTFVLPPSAMPDNGLSSSNAATLNNFCYQYRYDSRNRLAQKRIPGKDWEYMVYNKTDQIVATQDANQRLNKQWIFTKYDAIGRVIQTGIWDNNNTIISQADLQTLVNAQTINLWETRAPGNYYTTTSWPTSWTTTLSINVYDDYSYPGMLYNTPPSGTSMMTKGLLTATQIGVLGSSDKLWNVHYYDDLGRVTKTFKQHYLGGTANSANYDAITNTYSFTNQLTASTRQHYTTAGLAISIANTYAYDHADRKIKSFEQINNNNAIILLSQTDYNEIGQVKTKHLHSTDNGGSFLQNINYAYNERGWLRTSTTDGNLFNLDLRYNDQTSTTPQFNGNIANQFWITNGQAQKNYGYTYDALNRLTAGTSTTGNNESGITYDLVGNIKTLNRSGSIPANNVSLNYDNYNGNQLQSVKNSGVQYRTYGTYDGNGNAPTDGLGNNITYNLFNLPASIPNKGLTYTYDASGNKLRRIANGAVTEYIDGIQYDGTAITFIQTEEGRVLNLTGTPNFEYTLSDHLGNTRVTFDSSTGGNTAKQVDDYYPFGLVANEPNISSPKNYYLYNKKESQDQAGLNQYDYGTRFYDPIVARWTSVDSEVEKYSRWSPYNYVLDNPLSNIDPHGDTVRLATNSSEQFKKDYATMRSDLHSRGIDQNITKLENSKAVYTIKETDDTQGTFVANKNGKGKEHLLPGGTIFWNSTFALGTNNGTILSPESIFNHEADHGADYDTDPLGHYDRSRDPDAQYDNVEEKRVITGSEQKTALALGEIKPGQVSRTDHGGKQAYFTTSPLINKGVPIIMNLSLPEVKIIGTKTTPVNPKKDQ